MNRPTKVYATTIPGYGPAIVVQWQRATMPAPAFWYFETQAQAERARDLIDNPRQPGQVKTI